MNQHTTQEEAMNEHVEILTDEDDGMERVSKVAGRVVEGADRAVAERRESAPVTPMAMIDRALISGAAPETLEKLLALQERWEASQGRKAFDEAMASAKAEIPTIRKNRTVDFTSGKGRTHYRHEDLAEIAATINPILGKHGLSYRYRVNSEANVISVTCIVSHRLGYSEETTLSGRPDDSGNKNSLQQVGSTLTYLQRMTLKAALGLAASEDDDGAASGKTTQELRTISKEQIATILSLIDETETDTEQFCRLGKIEAIPDMLAADFDDAVRLLNQKKAKMHRGQAA
jgi:hypothetical protein